MIVGRFAPYTIEQQKAQEDNLDAEPLSAAVFNLLTLPFFAQTDERGPRIGSDKERPRKLKRIRKAFRPLVNQEVGADRTTRRMIFDGGEVVLENDEFKVVKAVWEEFRATLPAALADIAVAVDDWLEDCASFTPDEWQAELNRRSSATEPAAS